MRPLSPRLLWGAEREARVLAALKAERARRLQRKRVAYALCTVVFLVSAIVSYWGLQ